MLIWRMISVSFVVLVVVLGCGEGGGRSNKRGSSYLDRRIKEAKQLCKKGDEKFRQAMAKKMSGDQRSADSLFEEARQYFEQALAIYRRLNEEFPNKFTPALRDIQDRLLDINKEKGFSR